MAGFTRRDAARLTAAAAVGNLSAATSASDLCFLTATELARRIRRKDISAREVMRAHLDQIDRLNPKVNAIVTLIAEQAMKDAGEADAVLASGRAVGPLHGLPVAHKDLHETKGLRTTYGSPLFKNFVPERDAIIVERLKAAGAITVGKTNTPEFGAGSQTFNTLFGATRNPWDLSKTCGGSSGGAAVALACGMIPLADGSDMGGSLRNPAAFCGVVGLRPSAGRVPAYSLTAAWASLSVHGPMARNVADAAMMLSAIAGPDARSPISITESGSAFARSLERDFKGVRVAWMRDLGGVPFDSRVRAAVTARRKAFEDLGCIVEEAEPDFNGADEAFKILRAWSFEGNYAAAVREHRGQVKDTVIAEVERGAQLSGHDISHAEALRTALYHRVRVFMQRYEFFVLPVTQVPAFDVDQPYVKEINGVRMDTYIDWMKSCYYISIVGNPAISVPAGFTPEGLPVGLQIVGRNRDEWGILQMARAVEPSWRKPDVA